MKVTLKADFDLANEECKNSTGQSFEFWLNYLQERPELAAKRRDAAQ